MKKRKSLFRFFLVKRQIIKNEQFIRNTRSDGA